MDRSAINMKHIVAIPYYCREEIRRYFWIAEFLSQFAKSNSQYEFLLVSGPFINPSADLYEAFARLAPTSSMQCTSRQNSNHDGPGNMFWDTMEHISSHFPHDGGFVLWLESDMIPVKSDWIQKLEAEWLNEPKVNLMGHYIPAFTMKNGTVVPDHINGGACYSKDFVDVVPTPNKRFSQTQPARAFDIRFFPPVKKENRYKESESFAFGVHNRISEIIFAPDVTILHGYLQRKDAFIKECIAIVTAGHNGKKTVASRRMFSVQKIRRAHRCCKLSLWDGNALRCPIHSERERKSSL